MASQPTTEVIAAVLAGGLGSRIGGDKATVSLGGLPLIEYPLRAARAAGLRPFVVAKRSTRLPVLDATVLIEPDEPRHPLCGIARALRAHPAVLAIPCDMPFLPPEFLTALAQTVADAAAGQLDGRLQPFPALYRSAALPTIESALAAETSIRSALEGLAPTTVDVTRFGGADRDYLVVNSPADLERAAALL